MNHMKQIAEMLGVKLGEEFYITNSDLKHRLNDVGLQYLEPFIGQWINCHDRLFRLLNGDDEIVILPKSILDYKEKEYLSNVTKPFRDKITCITKYEYCNETEYINIEYEEGGMTYYVELPFFKKGTMYKGMKINKDYTLKELGL